MPDIEARITRTLQLAREALRVVEADPEVFRKAVERVEKANGGPLGDPGGQARRDPAGDRARPIERT